MKNRVTTKATVIAAVVIPTEAVRLTRDLGAGTGHACLPAGREHGAESRGWMGGWGDWETGRWGDQETGRWL